MTAVLNWTVGVAFGVSIVYSFFQRMETATRPILTASSPPQTSIAPAVDRLYQKSLSLPLSEILVSAIERECIAVPCNSELSSEARGWRVVRVARNSALFLGGFREGDLIPSQKIDESLAALDGPDYQLAQRSVRILNRLSQ